MNTANEGVPIGRPGAAPTLAAGPLSVAEIATLARELQIPVAPRILRHLHQRTGGIRAGVIVGLYAAGQAACGQPADAIDLAIGEWTREVLRTMPPILRDALVVAAIGIGLDAGELARICRIPRARAAEIVAQARASTLVSQADVLLAIAVEPLRQVHGRRRFHHVLRRVFRVRLDAGQLGAHTAMVLAESGLRDRHLAEFLCAEFRGSAAHQRSLDGARCRRAAIASGANPENLIPPGETSQQNPATRTLPTPAIHPPATRPNPRSPLTTAPANEEPQLPRATSGPAHPDYRLDNREREVAELILLGMTYREIGARLFISAKTVEHHAARIRRRIGAGSRTELLSMLRTMGHGCLLV